MTTERSNGARVAGLVLLLCLPLALLLANLYVVATPLFIRTEYARASFPRAQLFDDDERLSLAEATLHYLRSGEDLEYLRDLRSQGQQVYNQREIQHLVDVKAVMNAAFAVQAVAVLLCLAALLWLWRRKDTRSSAWQWFYRGCLLLFVSLLTVGVVAYFSFDVFFVFFHRVFFSGDTWLFAYTDTLIQLFPVQFWMDATWTLALLAVGESVLLGALSWLVYRRQIGRAGK